MLQLSITSVGLGEMYIDYQTGGIGFTVIHEKQQMDFHVDENEWEQIKSFIDDAIKREKNK